MSHVLTITLSEQAYATLAQRANAASRSPAELAAAAVESVFANGGPTSAPSRPLSDADRHTARLRFERLFGAVDLGHPTGTDNQAIDADLARAYENDHKGA